MPLLHVLRSYSQSQCHYETLLLYKVQSPTHTLNKVDAILSTAECDYYVSLSRRSMFLDSSNVHTHCCRLLSSFTDVFQY